jgi:DNA-binding response OmpR family regulator
VTTPTEPATILVVDDDRDSREIAARLLEKAGYRALRAESGAQALKIVDEEPIHLLLLDVMMPEMDGFAVCEALQARGKRIPIILLTAKDDMDTRLEGMHHGVSEFLTKPINKVELFARVRAQLHILDLARQLEAVEENVQAIRRPDSTRPRS